MPNSLSLSRTDHTKGYVVDNLEITSNTWNMARGFTQSEFEPEILNRFYNIRTHNMERFWQLPGLDEARSEEELYPRLSAQNHRLLVGEDDEDDIISINEYSDEDEPSEED